jgi:hypothetical protein
LFSNGFEVVEGQLSAVDEQWQVAFGADHSEQLELDGDELVQAAGQNTPEQQFEKALVLAPAGAPVGSSFEKALYGAYLGGAWKIVEGPGRGGMVRFADNGSVDGLPDLNRYALCLAGDCASISGQYDSLWLERDRQGSPWIFTRDGDTLEIFQALNAAQPDEMPQLKPGARKWLLEKD